MNVYTLTKCKQKLLASLSLSVFPEILDNAAQSKTLNTGKTVFILYKLVLLLVGKQLTTEDAFMIVLDWAAAARSVDCCLHLLGLLQVGLTLTGTANVLAVVQGQVGDLITPLGFLMQVMKKEVLLVFLPGLVPKPVVVRAASNLAIETLLKKLGEVQIEVLK